MTRLQRFEIELPWVPCLVHYCGVVTSSLQQSVYVAVPFVPTSALVGHRIRADKYVCSCVDETVIAADQWSRLVRGARYIAPNWTQLECNELIVPCQPLISPIVVVACVFL